MTTQDGLWLMIMAAGIAGLVVGFRFSRNHGWRKENPASWILYAVLAILFFAFYVGSLMYHPTAILAVNEYSPAWYAWITIFGGGLLILIVSMISSFLFGAIRTAGGIKTGT